MNNIQNITLTKTEKLLLADVLNGCNSWLGIHYEDGQRIQVESDPFWLDSMAGSVSGPDAAVIGRDEQGRVLLIGSNICSSLEHEVHDSIRLDHLDQKWEVDGFELLHKIRAMTPDQRRALITAIAEIWARHDDRFDQDLQAITV